MDDFEEYWSMLPDQDNGVHMELLSRFKSPVNSPISSNSILFLEQSLRKNTYAACNVIRLFPEVSDHIVYRSLLYQIKHLERTDERQKLFNLLSNYDLSEAFISKAQQEMFPRLLAYIKENECDRMKLWFCLIAAQNKPHNTLKSFLDFYKKHTVDDFTNSSIFIEAIEEKSHFLCRFLSRKYSWDHFPHQLKDSVYVARLISNVHKPKSSVQKVLAQLNKIDLNQYAGTANRLFMCELIRLLSLQYALNHHIPHMQIESLISRFNIIEYLVQNVDLAAFEYAAIKRILLKNQQSNTEIRLVCHQQDNTIDQPYVNELELYEQYSAIKLMLDVILLNYHTENYEQIVNNRLEAAKKILRSIETFPAYVDVLETAFSLLFLRWEHVCANSYSNGDQTIEPLTEGEIDLQKVPLKKYEKFGFISTSVCVGGILNLLKNSATQKKHSQQYAEAENRYKEQFHRICDTINDALWRYSLLKTTVNYSNYSAQLEFSKILQKHQHLARQKTSSSTDDDDTNPSNNNDENRRKSMPATLSMRRKPRRKIHFRNSDGDKSLSFSHSTENELKVCSQMTSIRTTISNRDKQCIVDRMLGSGEHLAATCLRKGDLETTKNILKLNNLEDSPFAQELTFSENLNQTKQKLRDIFHKYSKEDLGTECNQSQIERIKKVAAVGFEASKITNIMANFAMTNKIKQCTDAKALVERFGDKYSILRSFNDANLQTTIVVDFVLSLANNYEICLNIFNMLRKTWPGFDSTGDDDMISGCFRFFENLLESLRLYKTILREDVSVKTLMCDECYSLNRNELNRKLEKEKLYTDMLKVNQNQIDSLEDLCKFAKIADGFSDGINFLKRFTSFVGNVKRLLQFKDTSKKTLGEIIQLDLYQLIGQIIFDHGVSPLEIEHVTTNMNINLIHVLAVTTSPAIDLKRTGLDEDKRHLQAMMDYVQENTESLTSIGSENSIKLFKLTDSKVENYLKKHNVLLTFLLNEIQQISDNHVVTFDPLLLQNLTNLDEVKVMACLYDNNKILAALNYDRFDAVGIRNYFSTNSSIRTILDIFKNIKELQRQNFGIQIRTLINSLIVRSLRENGTEFNSDLIEEISNINTRTECFLNHIHDIQSSDVAKEMIQNILLHCDASELNDFHRMSLTKWLHDIKIYADIGAVIDGDTMTWSKVMQLSTESPEEILQSLLEQKMYRLCVAWAKVYPFQLQITKINEFLRIFSAVLLNENQLNPMLVELIESLPTENVVQLFTNLLTAVRNLDVLNYLLDFLRKNSKTNFQKYQITLKIIEQLSIDERDCVWNLLSMPLLIIEQYLMNAKFETLSIILGAIKPLLFEAKCMQCNMRLETVFEESPYDDIDCASNLDRNHCLTKQCLDSLLRNYATKALDFRITEPKSSTDLLSQSTEAESLDSLCGSFFMPKDAPERNDWIRDEEASHCMCCRRARFSMLSRRHHCRRCGRVVCHGCSIKRLQVPNLYADILVRVCDDCFRQTEIQKQKIEKKNDSLHRSDSPGFRRSSETLTEWRFTGNLKHDAMLREEFSFEYAPSVSLCLSILSYHSVDSDYANFLLYHCRKLEQLLRPIQPGYPNPEIDYALVTRMLNCLALAAKVRGNLPECDDVRDHAEIIRSVVKNGCESLLPMEPPNTSSFRKLRDSLVMAEKWSLALEVSLKCGFSTTGVMAAWGISSLKAGCFETAREKFIHCLPRVLNDFQQYKILALVSSDSSVDLSSVEEFPQINRPPKSSQLLNEILTILETSCRPTKADVLARASLIKDSNSSLSSKKSRKKENIPLHEPALNILHSLSNLKQIAQGVYDCPVKDSGQANTATMRYRKLWPNNRFYDESLYYLINFGSHINIVQFLIKHDHLFTALKYIIFQNVDPDAFVHTAFMPYLRQGKAESIITVMLVLDETLLLWKKYIIHTCRYLERKGLLNSLYHLQILLDDPIRASMTCVRFYSMYCTSFKDLQTNSFHLMNAQKHLQAELELCQWEEIKVKNTKKATFHNNQDTFIMKMDSKTLNNHINTIWRQIEVTKFLAKCESDGRETVSILPKICSNSGQIPTLFGTIQEKVQLVILTLICGTNIVEGFGLAFRIIQDFNLSTIKAFGSTAKYLAGNDRLSSVEKLIDCIKSNNGCDTSFCDEIISHSIQTAVTSASPLNSNAEMKGHFVNLIRLVNDVGTKISCHIIGGQLKAAYLLAVQHNRLNDVKRVWRQADQTNQSHIKKLCEKKLNISRSEDFKL